MAGGYTAAASVSGSSKSPVKSRQTSSPSIGPKPAIAPGALKSQEFSDRPTKSRIAGSNDHTRRSAARAKSSATPVSRKADIGFGANGFDCRQTRRIEWQSIFARRKGSRSSFRRHVDQSSRSASIPVRSRVMLATGSRKKIRIVTHRRSCIAGHAVPALPDPHDCACASRRSARHGVR